MATNKRWDADEDLLVYLDEALDLTSRITNCLLDRYNMTGDDIPDHILDTADILKRAEAQNLFPGGVPASVPEELVDELAQTIAKGLATRIQHALTDSQTRYAVWNTLEEASEPRRLTAGLTCREAVAFRIVQHERPDDESELHIYPEGQAPWEQAPGAAAA